jgi:hypothetical protein
MVYVFCFWRCGEKKEFELIPPLPHMNVAHGVYIRRSTLYPALGTISFRAFSLVVIPIVSCLQSSLLVCCTLKQSSFQKEVLNSVSLGILHVF